jgi:hypothetical protein
MKGKAKMKKMINRPGKVKYALYGGSPAIFAFRYSERYQLPRMEAAARMQMN